MSDTVHLRSAGAPNGVGEYYWSDPDAVVAVDASLAHQLLSIHQGGFTVAERYDARPPRKAAPEPPPIVDPPLATPPESSLAEGLQLVQATKGPRARKG